MKNYGHIISVPFTKKTKILLITACLAILLAFCWQGGHSAEDVRPHPAGVKLTAKASSQVKQGLACGASKQAGKSAGGCCGEPSSSVKKAACGGCQGSAKPAFASGSKTSAPQKKVVALVASKQTGNSEGGCCGKSSSSPTKKAGCGGSQGLAEPAFASGGKTSSPQMEVVACGASKQASNSAGGCCGKPSSSSAKQAGCGGCQGSAKPAFASGSTTSAQQKGVVALIASKQADNSAGGCCGEPSSSAKKAGCGGSQGSAKPAFASGGKTSSPQKAGFVCPSCQNAGKSAGDCCSEPSSSQTKKAGCGGCQGSAQPAFASGDKTSAPLKAGFVCSSCLKAGKPAGGCGSKPSSSKAKKAGCGGCQGAAKPAAASGGKTSSPQKPGFVCPSCQNAGKSTKKAVCGGCQGAAKPAAASGDKTSSPQSSGSTGPIAKVNPSRLSSAAAILTDEQMKQLKGGHCTCLGCSSSSCDCGGAPPTICAITCIDPFDPAQDCPGTGGIVCEWCVGDTEGSPDCGGIGDDCPCGGYSCNGTSVCDAHCSLDTDPADVEPCGGELNCTCPGDNCPGPLACAQCPGTSTYPGCEPEDCECLGIGNPCSCADYCSRSDPDCSGVSNACADCDAPCPGDGTCKWCSLDLPPNCGAPKLCTPADCAGAGDCPGGANCKRCSTATGGSDCGGNKHTCSSPTQHCNATTGCTTTACPDEHCSALTGPGHTTPCDGESSCGSDGSSCNDPSGDCPGEGPCEGCSNGTNQCGGVPDECECGCPSGACVTRCGKETGTYEPCGGKTSCGGIPAPPESKSDCRQYPCYCDDYCPVQYSSSSPQCGNKQDCDECGSGFCEDCCCECKMDGPSPAFGYCQVDLMNFCQCLTDAGCPCRCLDD